jgi:transcriptional regulator with XRE-family HTH domain
VDGAKASSGGENRTAITCQVIATIRRKEVNSAMSTTFSDPHAGHAASGFGSMLREWRRARGASQLDLSLICGMSQRHLSFLESGRSRPSRSMVLHLASALTLPLRQQNAMLLSAGFAPVYKERALDAPDMRPVEQAISHALRQQEPYPAILVDGSYNILRSNHALRILLGFLLGTERAAVAAQAPINAVEIVLNPDGLRPFIDNWNEVAGWLLRRLRAEVMLEGPDRETAPLLDRVLALPEVAQVAQANTALEDLPPTLVVRFCKGDVRLALFSMIATIGTPLDVSLQNLRLELFFPADDATAAWFAAASSAAAAT